MGQYTRPGFFRKKIRIFRKMALKNLKNSKNIYLTFDTIWLQIG
jgi:hypothetical protein